MDGKPNGANNKISDRTNAGERVRWDAKTEALMDQRSPIRNPALIEEYLERSRKLHGRG